MKRTARIDLRVAPVEKAVMLERAEAAGVELSEFLRQLGLTGTIGTARKAKRPEPTDAEQAVFDRRVRELSRTMPRGNAEREARRERAKAALG